MTIGTSNRVAMRRVKETTLGVVPTTPTLLDTRYTGEGLNFAPTNISSNEIRSDRQTSDLVQVGSDASGNLDFELSYGSYDDLIQAALFSGAPVTVNMAAVTTISVTESTATFADSGNGFVTAGIVVGMWIKVSGFTTAGNNGFFRVLTVAAGAITVADPNNSLADEIAGDAVTIVATMRRNGVTRESFVIQKHIQDVATPTFINYVGCVISQMSLEFATGAILTGSFDVQGIGVDSSSPGDSQISGTSITPVNTNTPMNAVNNVVNVLEDDAVTASRFSSISLTINNNVRTVDAVANLYHIDIRPGKLEVTGALNIYYENKTAYQRFINGTEFAFSFRVQDIDGNAYIFTFPRVKFNTGSVVAGGLDSDMVMESEFTAIADSVTGCTIQVDSFAA